MNSPKQMHGKRVYSLMGCPCLPFSSVEEAKRLLVHIGSEKTGGYALAVNAEKALRCRNDPEFRPIATGSILPTPDGAGALLGLRLLYGVKTIKLDLPKAVLEVADSQRWRLFVLGSREEVNELATARIRTVYPNIEVVGRLNGYVDEESMLQAVKVAKPQVLLAALGSPKQEQWAHKVQGELPGVLIIGCGGALDVMSGKVQRAPQFMIDNYLEWLYRLNKDKSRWRRYLALPHFAGLLLLEIGKKKLQGRGAD